jgi:hypothetical protein
MVFASTASISVPSSLPTPPYIQNVTFSHECVDSVEQITQRPSKILSLLSRKIPTTTYHKVIPNKRFGIKYNYRLL